MNKTVVNGKGVKMPRWETSKGRSTENIGKSGSEIFFGLVIASRCHHLLGHYMLNTLKSVYSV